MTNTFGQTKALELIAAVKRGDWSPTPGIDLTEVRTSTLYLLHQALQEILTIVMKGQGNIFKERESRAKQLREASKRLVGRH